MRPAADWKPAPLSLRLISAIGSGERERGKKGCAGGRRGLAHDASPTAAGLAPPPALRAGGGKPKGPEGGGGKRDEGEGQEPPLPRRSGGGWAVGDDRENVDIPEA